MQPTGSPLTPAVAAGSVSIVTALANAAAGPLGVVQALPALARAPVAGAHVRHVDVVAALAGLAAAAGLRGVAMVTWGAFVAACTCAGGPGTGGQV